MKEERAPQNVNENVSVREFVMLGSRPALFCVVSTKPQKTAENQTRSQKIIATRKIIK